MRDTMTGEIYERNHLTHSSFAGYSYTLSVCGVGGGGLVDEERATPRVHRTAYGKNVIKIGRKFDFWRIFIFLNFL